MTLLSMELNIADMGGVLLTKGFSWGRATITVEYLPEALALRQIGQARRRMKPSASSKLTGSCLLIGAVSPPQDHRLRSTGN